jgi:hypothetical protein
LIKPRLRTAEFGTFGAERAFSGPNHTPCETPLSARERATAPSQDALGLGWRANVCRSTATRPNVGA